MRKFFIYCLISIVTGLILTSCEKILDVKSSTIIDPDAQEYKTADDVTYSMISILNYMQKLGERYVLLGELRGDLMDVSENTDIDLRQINDFDVKAGNKYTNIRDFYSLINNCNYVITHTDTTLLTGGEYILKRSLSAAKVFRAWAYIQVAVHYGKAYWLEQPILDIDEALKAKQTEELGIEEIANKLIPDILPFVNTPFPSSFYGNYFSVRYLLGELYLWVGQYENAAIQFQICIKNYNVTSNTIVIRDYYRWVINNGDITDMINGYYITNNYLTQIYTSSEHGEGSHLSEYSLSLKSGGKYWIKPSSVAITNWDSTVYYDQDNITYTYGDLRGYFVNYYQEDGRYTDKFNGQSIPGYNCYIRKFPNRFTKNSNINYENIYMVTPALVYLRYAEAVNRMGKPNLAFAVLKNGLNNVNIKNSTIVPPSERPDPLPEYMNFNLTPFNENIGIHSHGCGYPSALYKIPKCVDMNDSIEKVEDLIIQELALETAFEGNRYHDLMRVAMRRNDNSYLANAIAKKHKGNEQYYKTLLLDRNNWYLPKD